jgi:hypothetical protein
VRKLGGVSVGTFACLCTLLGVLGPAGTAVAAGLPSTTPFSAHVPLHVWTSADPAANTITTTAPASEQLSSYGRPIRVGHSQYWLNLDVFTFEPGSSPELDIVLVRGRPGHFQLHEYWWLRRASLAVDGPAMTARLNGGAISPSASSMRFTPMHVWSHTCTLVGGGTGTYRKAIGMLSASAFRVVTNTSPVFGTITVRPRKAQLVVDPGCRSSIVHFNPHPCPSSELIDAPGPAPSEWGAATNGSDTRAAIDAVSASMTPTKLQHAHITEETLPLSDLPPPTVSAGGATATFLTRGSLYATGVGIFSSTRAPSVVTGSCTRAGVAHTFTASVYRGVLSSGASPLIALFDTGRIGLAATPAFFWVSHLTS